jgi:trigger factor
VDQFVDGSDFKYTATIEVLPEFELKGIDKIKVEKLTSTVTQSDINDMIENLQKQRGEWTAVDKTSEKGNQLLIDFVGKIDDEPFEGGSADDFVIEVGSGQMLPEFDQALEGVKSGDEKEFNLTFPKDYHKEDLSNKVAVFNIKVKEVKELKPAEINDEFVKGFGIESGQSDDLMKEIKDSMEKEKESKIKNDLRINLMKYLRENNKIDIPSVMVHREAHAMQKDWMRQSGIEDEEKALPVSNFEEIASERVHLGLLVNELVISRELKLDDDKVETKLEEMTKAYPNGDEIRKMYEQTPELMDQLKSMVMEDQVVDWLTEHSTFTEKEIEFKELINKQQ